ncbi:predicted protein [Postia placenta Mad-698-R]|nr:predicted protein [Postia placenta Mad-698-R]
MRWSPYVVHVVVFCLWSFLFIRLPSCTDRQCARRLSTPSPALEAIDYHAVLFNGSLSHSSIFRGPPSPRLDAAWDEITLVPFLTTVFPYDTGTCRGNSLSRRCFEAVRETKTPNGTQDAGCCVKETDRPHMIEFDSLSITFQRHNFVALAILSAAVILSLSRIWRAQNPRNGDVPTRSDDLCSSSDKTAPNPLQYGSGKPEGGAWDAKGPGYLPPDPLSDFGLSTASVRDYVYVNKVLQYPYSQPMHIHGWIEIEPREYKWYLDEKAYIIREQDQLLDEGKTLVNQAVRDPAMSVYCMYEGEDIKGTIQGCVANADFGGI